MDRQTSRFSYYMRTSCGDRRVYENYGNVGAKGLALEYQDSRLIQQARGAKFRHRRLQLGTLMQSYSIYPD